MFYRFCLFIFKKSNSPIMAFFQFINLFSTSLSATLLPALPTTGVYEQHIIFHSVTFLLSRICTRRIFPLMVFGNSSTNSMMRGYL